MPPPTSPRAKPSTPVTFAILPIKRFAASKARLEGELSDGTRRALTEAMMTDVLMALRRTQGLTVVLLITSEPAAEAIGRGYGATVLLDDFNAGQSAATSIGIEHAIEAGARRVLLVPGDCPALDPAELTALLATEAPGRSVVIVPDRHGSGTNALLLAPPNAIEPAFGPDSRALHERAATAAGVGFVVAQVPTLALDVDTVDDLDALRGALATRRGGAAHTRGMLSRFANSRSVPVQDGS
ncbi:MAG: 2-phospho-L-lactate guanylyltransferase [Solirubrobacteraceae bacterium]